MWLLAIERSTASGSVALYQDGRCRLLRADDPDAAPRPDLSEVVRTALGEVGLDAAGLGRLAVGLGPGSFAGIRSALAFLTGLGLPSGLRVEGVGSAAALALAAFRQDPALPEVVVVGDARRGCCWHAGYRRTASTLRGVGAPAACPRAGLVAAISPTAAVVSPDGARLGDWLDAVLPAGQYRREPSAPSAAFVAELALDPTAPRIDPPRPLYLHAAVRGPDHSRER